MLEIGTVEPSTSLLQLPSLRGARSRVGLNREAVPEIAGFPVVRADANDLSLFADGSFDTVLSNAVLEHDPYFWRSLAEMRRVTRPGGLIAIGVPGFMKLPIERTMRRLARLPFLRPAVGDGLPASTLCLQVHLFPGDYYRFSPQAVQEVMLEGLTETAVRTLLVPPRIIGAGIKP